MMNNLPSPIPYHTYYGAPINPPAIYDYVTDAAGVVMRVKTPHFYTVHRVAFGHVRGLRRWPEEGVLLSVPKIPALWLTRVLAHARRCGDGGQVSRPIEQMYHFHHLDTGWQVSVPKQLATAARVTYRGGQETSVVLDLHSHHEMGAFFSSTDDRDELGARFYGVIGRIYSAPQIKLRLGLYGEFWELPATTLFEGLGPFADVYQEEVNQVDQWSDEELERLAGSRQQADLEDDRKSYGG